MVRMTCNPPSWRRGAYIPGFWAAFVGSQNLKTSERFRVQGYTRTLKPEDPQGRGVKGVSLEEPPPGNGCIIGFY